MIVIVGLVVLLVAVIVGFTGVLTYLTPTSRDRIRLLGRWSRGRQPTGAAHVAGRR
jgi:hypothetical protein